MHFEGIAFHFRALTVPRARCGVINNFFFLFYLPAKRGDQPKYTEGWPLDFASARTGGTLTHGLLLLVKESRVLFRIT